MAEAVATVGLVAAVLQITAYGTKLIERLNDFRKSLDEVPKAFADIALELPLLLDILNRTKVQAESGAIDQASQEALLPVVKECLSRVDMLHNVLIRSLPLKEDSSWKRSVKALSSISHEKKIEQIVTGLRHHVQLLTYHQATGFSTPVILPKKPKFLVPFDRDANFIGREYVITQIDDAFEKSRRVALSGIGGVGKSQIAIEYCYRYRESDAEAAVYWIHGSSVDRFDQAYRDIARRLSLARTDDAAVDHLQHVSDWLGDNGPWLLVVDNVDDLDTFFLKSNSLPKPLSAYLPQTSNGRILITTRDRRVGERLTGRTSCIQVISPNGTEATQLLNSKLPDDDYDLEACSPLLEKLAYLPLAITQAAAFMTENNISLSGYMDVLEAHDLEFIHFLNEDSGDIRRDSETSNSVIKTWKISFDQICRQKRRAADILSLMAVLDPQGVPKVLLERTGEPMTEFITATGTLQAFSLITVDKDKTNYKMHHLVQLAMEQWLRLEGSLTSTQLEALQCVEEAYPCGEFESWQTCELLYPHAQIVTKHDSQDHNSRLTQAGLLFKLAQYQLERGRFKQARQHITSAVEIEEELLGPEDIQTIRSRSILGDCYRRSGEFKLAQKVLREALTKFETLVGPNHLDTLNTKMRLACSFTNDNQREQELMYREIMTALEKKELSQTEVWFANQHNLAHNLWAQGRLKESEDLYTQAVVGKQMILGPEHPSTLLSMERLSNFYKKDDEEEAENRLREVLRLQEKVLGPDHPTTLNTTNNLANLLSRRARLEEAEEVALPVLQKLEKALGPKHPSTLEVVTNLATIYRNQGRVALAKELFERAVQGHVEVLGPNHPKTLSAWWCYMEMPPEWRLIDKQRAFNADHPVSITALDDHARKLYSQGRYPEAETPARIATAQYEKILGPNSLAYRWALYRLAWILVKLYKNDEAEELCRVALSVAEKTLWKDADFYMELLRTLGVTLASQGKIEEAEEQYHKALARHEGRNQYEAAELEFRTLVASYEKVFGFDDPNTQASVVALIITLEKEGKYAEAEELAVNVIAAYGRIRGIDHPDTATSQWVLAKFLWRQGKLDEAEEICRKALTTQLKMLGSEQRDTLDSQLLLTKILRDCGKLDEAEEMCRKTLTTQLKVLGPEQRHTLDSQLLLTKILRDYGKLDEAEEMCRKTLTTQLKVLGPEQRDTLDSQLLLTKILRDCGKLDEAEEMCRKTLTTQLEVLGPEQRHTLNSRLFLIQILRGCGKLDEALSMGMMVVELVERVYGMDNPETLSSGELVAEIAGRIEEREEAECAPAEYDLEGSGSSLSSFSGLSITEGQGTT